MPIRRLRTLSLHDALPIWGPEWCPEDLGALGLEHIVEARHVLGVSVADQEPGGNLCVGEVTGDVPGLLGDPRCIGMSGHPGDPDSPTSEFDEEQDIEAFEQDGVDRS